MDINRYVKWLKPPVFLLSLGPLALLVYKAYHDTQFPDAVPLLGGNPQSFIRNSTGFWTLVFICITIGITPVRRLLRQNWLIRFRRMMGLFAFFYGTLHFVTYFLFDTGVDLRAVANDVYMRPFITAGFVAWLLMVPLAITSTAGWVRRLGGKRWQKLHYLVYGTAIAAALHYWWLVKADITVPRRFAVIVALFLGYRVVAYFVKKRNEAALAQARAAKNVTAKVPPAKSPAVSPVSGRSLSDTGADNS
jgi:methionine sulfoxide reductase heme-binding subunit